MPHDAKPETWAAMSGQAFREVGVLTLVFGLLDELLLPEGPSLGWTTATLGIALASFVFGGVLERRGRT